MRELWTATATDYLQALRGLLPRGLLWATEAPRRLTRLLLGQAEEFARVHNRANALVEEADPATATEAGALADHERIRGLPEGGYAPTSVADRRAAILAKDAATGGQSLGYFQGLAVTLGEAGAECTDGPVPMVWTVHLPVAVRRFRAGDPCGGPLITFTATGKRIRYYLEKFKPAHTFVYWTGP